MSSGAIFVELMIFLTANFHQAALLMNESNNLGEPKIPKRKRRSHRLAIAGKPNCLWSK